MSQDFDMAGKKLCKLCSERIEATACFCNQCKSYQDWRSYIGLSQPVLTWLLAVIAIVTVFAPLAAGVAKSFFERKSPYFEFLSVTSYCLGNAGQRIDVFVSNPLENYQVITDADLFITFSDQNDSKRITTSRDIDVRMKLEDGKIVEGPFPIRPGEAAPMTFGFLPESVAIVMLNAGGRPLIADKNSGGNVTVRSMDVRFTYMVPGGGKEESAPMHVVLNQEKDPKTQPLQITLGSYESDTQTRRCTDMKGD